METYSITWGNFLFKYKSLVGWGGYLFGLFVCFNGMVQRIKLGCKRSIQAHAPLENITR